ncbi:unnamed protein product [Mytilus coruscus]|uniref:Reverse transcriptase domain-containing protein n=1 Tax=Mytilus coruscus TaxID=42192 RepID=A0A6J8AUF3_MYTCO|nr:unnamed protein product [Mytilus coruscus]
MMEKAVYKRSGITSKIIMLQDQLQVTYRTKDKVKRSARKDKRQYLEDLAKEAEQAAILGELSTVYKITKQLCRTSNAQTAHVNDKNGKSLKTEREQAERWVHHFKEVLNCPESDVIANPEISEDDLNINTEQPTLEKEGDIPSDWSKGLIVKLPKKGNLRNCDNWRGITLLSVTIKVFCKILLKLIDKIVDEKLREGQAGFRRGRGCIDQIFTLRNIIEQCIEWNTPLFINFIDFKKAFDSIHKKLLGELLNHMDFHLKF